MPNCLIDKHQMGQVMINILNNAEHALVSHQGGGNIDIGIRSTPDSVILQVGDDGPGIEPELMPKIFEPFFTTKSAGEGTGLGLSICYGIIQQHGGEMWAENNESAGTSFFIQLPIAEEELILQPAAPHLEADEDKSKTRLLIVDDEPAILDLVNRSLRGEIDITHQANAGDVALEMIRDSEYDCILLDLRMPGINGMELYRRVVASDPNLADRIIFMTGDTARPESAAFLSDKKNPVISKPFQPEQIRLVIGSVVSASPNL
ncbi:MAG: response regulator [Chloroflexi bacterium]|nr:response regulator [Chloroflexota bacterium]